MEQGSAATYQSDGFYYFLLPDGDWHIYPVAQEAAARQLLFVNLPQFNIEAGVNDDLEAHIDVVDPTGEIAYTLLDENNDPVVGVYLHAFAVDGGDRFDSFAETDATGVARIPVINGTWTIHVSDRSLSEAGLQALPTIQASINGAQATASQQATSFSNLSPLIDFALHDSDNVVNYFTGVGESGQSYVIEASFDLENWLPIGSVLSVGDEFRVYDVSGNSDETTYYRVSTP